MTGGRYGLIKKQLKSGQCIPYFSHCGKIPNKANMKEMSLCHGLGVWSVTAREALLEATSLCLQSGSRGRWMIQLASSSLASPETQAPERWPHSKCVSPVKSNLSRSTRVDTSGGVSMVVSSQD